VKGEIGLVEAAYKVAGCFNAGRLRKNRMGIYIKEKY